MTEKNRSDVLIIGGGPAGLSAAMWSIELGLDTILIERAPDIGGQMHHIHGSIDNYLGLRAENGAELLAHFRASVDHSGVRRMTGAEGVSIDHASRELNLRDGKALGYDALIIATGVRRRRLDVEGESEFTGKGIIDSGMRDRDHAAGRRVVIVGGGDAAIENALILSDVAATIKVVHRRDEFVARPEFMTLVKKKNNIDLVTDSVVKRIVGNVNIEAVEIESTSNSSASRLPADIVLIRIGVEPNSELVRGIIELNERGYVRVDAGCNTSVERILAAGDVANPVSPTLSTAAGMGATAAKSAYMLLKT